jgi:putative transcriptional regulator
LHRIFSVPQGVFHFSRNAVISTLTVQHFSSFFRVPLADSNHVGTLRTYECTFGVSFCFALSFLSLMSTAQLKNAIRRLRFERNMTQEELALRVGVSRQTVMSIEQGRTNPSVLLALKIARALSAEVTEVFSMEGNLAPV